MHVKNHSLGTDFELFIKDKRTNEIISAEGFIKGSKYKPFIFDKKNRHFSTSLDNVLAEATIPPVKNSLEWLTYIAKSRKYIESILPEHLCTVAEPAAILDRRFLKTKNAQTFGCEPDNCVWTREPNEPPRASNPYLRSAGAHIHTGYDNPSTEVSEMIIKAYDLFIGVPSVIQEPDNQRKLLYGKAGAFRFKPYGVEYRTVSNYYLVTDNLTKWAFEAAEAAIDFVNEDRMDELEVVKEQVVECINNNDKKTADRLIRHFNLNLA